MDENIKKRPKRPPSVLIGFARNKYFPNIVRRLENMESDVEIKKISIRIQEWYSRANARNKSDESINELKLEAGRIIVDFNYWFSDRDNEGFQEI